MSKKIQLTIADPCHENWDQMTPGSKGRLCASCQKQVIDFTNVSDSQLVAFFKKPSTGSVCGRFYHDQLDRDIEIPRKRIPWVKYFFQFALPAFLVSMKATAQGNVKAKIVSNTASVPKANCNILVGDVEERITLMGDTILTPAQKTERIAAAMKRREQIESRLSSPSLTLSGRVVDEDNNPVPYATVVIKGTTIGTVANDIGVFKLENLSSSEITLEVSSIGYNSKEMLINNGTDFTKELLIPLTIQVMGEVIVVGYPNYVKGKVAVGGAVSVKTEKTIADSTMKSPAQIQAMIKVYPNPVASGTNINVGCQKLKEGYYIIQLITQSGQQVLTKQTWIDDDLQVLNIAIPHIAEGVYFLKLTNKETSKRFTQKIIVE